MTEVRTSSLCERPYADIEETGEAPSDAGGMECSRRRKVHSLIDKVYDPANLAEAWKRVRESKGSAGIDGRPHHRRVRATTGRTSGEAAQAAAREDLSALTGETGGDTEARGWNEKSRHSICPRLGGSTGPGAEDEIPSSNRCLPTARLDIDPADRHTWRCGRCGGKSKRATSGF
jgi:hypothetical protein